MKESIQHTNKLANLPMEELGQMLRRHPYSANLRWEIIKRRLKKGEISDEELARESLFMNDPRAFFSEVESIKFSLSTGGSEVNPASDAADQSEPTASTGPEEATEHGEVNLPSEKNTDSADKSEEAGPAALENQEVEISEEIPPGEGEDRSLAGPVPADTLDDPEPTTEEEKTVPEIEEEIVHENGGERDEDVERDELKSHSVSPPECHFETEGETEGLSEFVKWLKKSRKSQSGQSAEGRGNISEDAVAHKEGRDAGESTAKKKEKKKKKKKRDKKVSELELQPDIASETLADLLASQGHYDEANEMYKRLSLLYPEKSSYFASKIKKV